MNRLAIVVALALVGGPVCAQTAAPVAAVPLVQKWVPFTDPKERAFTVAVPQGWKIEGGTQRWNALQYRFWLRVATPDGSTILAINDATDFFYTIPTPVLAGAGFHEGSLYSPTGVTFYKVARYQNGAQYAASWGQRKLAALCGAVRLVGNQSRPELTQEINRNARLLGMSRDAGEAGFTCSAGGLAMTAFVQATVNTVGDQSGGLWWADPIVSFLAPSPMAGTAAGLVARIMKSVQFDAGWFARQGDTNGAVARITAETNASISATIMRGWQDRGAIIDRVMEEGSRARLGIDVYANPTTGTQYVVPNDHHFYWVNPAGIVRGTDVDRAPDGFTRLDRVPPR